MDPLSWGDLLQAVIVLLAAELAVGVALWQVYEQRNIASRELTEQRNIASLKYTHNMIVREEIMGPVWTRMSTIAYGVFKMDCSQWASLQEDPAKRRHYATTLSFLNYFELIAIGIEKRAIDEDLYKVWFKSAYVGTWDRATGFVEWLRLLDNGRRKVAYVQFEQLAKKWRDS